MNAVADSLMSVFGFKRVESEMTDRELLEMAALAAGYALTDGSRGYDEFKCKGGVKWNPLTDDGDALRLAVKVKLKVDPVYVFDGPWGDGGTLQDPYAATRRAIVRAAASIGEGME